jgi:hypothetical protein
VAEIVHTIEPSASGRAKCRGCGEKIAKDELRLGARLPNPFVDGELTLWFHLVCGAYKRPEPYLEAAKTTSETIVEAESLEAEAKRSLEFERLPRLNGADRAPTGRARCRSCRNLIEKAAWRISVVYYDEVEGRFQPSGYLHPKCAQEYFGTSDIVDRLQHFSPELEPSYVAELEAELKATPESAP